jgi:2-polyprenyl-3-methyl-5-hydroxy-6-metoxy-1,4-benzoquinol methylase
MDSGTLQAYDKLSQTYADDWRNQPAPTDMYVLLKRYFEPGKTIDVGCGGGRDVAWLRDNGFDASGVDGSSGLLAEARESYPQIEFGLATLPHLAELRAGTYQNVLCETVLMHLEIDEIKTAAIALFTLLQPGGVIYLSWRVTVGMSIRDDNGRLYSSFEKQVVLDTVPGDATILLDQEVVSASSKKVIHRLIVKRKG